MAHLAASLLLTFVFLFLLSPDVEAAPYRLYFRHGGTVDVDSYEDTGNAIAYPRFGGVITVPKTDLARIEDLQTGEKVNLNQPLSPEELERQRKEQARILQGRNVTEGGTTFHQSDAGSPSDSGSYSSGTSKHTPGRDVSVRGYTRKDGTYVPPYTRSAPGTRR